MNKINVRKVWFKRNTWPLLLLFVVMMCSFGCFKDERIDINQLPELKPFLNVCGRYLGDAGADLDWVEFEFKPILRKDELLLSFDRIAEREGWIHCEQDKFQKMSRLYSKTNDVIQPMLSMMLYFKNGTMHLCLQKGAQRSEAKGDAQRKPYLKNN